MSKRIIAFILSLLMLFSLVACGDTKINEPVQTDPTVTTTEATTTEATTTEATTTEATTEATTTTADTTEEVTTTTEATTTTAVTTAEVTTTPATEPEPEWSIETANEKLYATADLNVRATPEQDGERISHVDKGELVEVTGWVDNGWARIKFRDGEYFVNGKYLSKDKPAETTTATEATTAEKPEEGDPLFINVPVTKENNQIAADAGNAKWNSDGSLTVKNTSLISFTLPESIPMDETVVARIKGKSAGNFRVWLLDAGQVTSSNQVNVQNDFGFMGGEFELLVELTVQYIDNNIADNLAKQIAFKAPSWNTNLDDFTIESIEIFKGTMKEYRKFLKAESGDDNVTSAEKTKWVASWGSAMLKAGSDHLPKNNKLAGSTVRQQIRTTVAGDVLRLYLSNEYGEKDLVIDAMYIAKLINPSKSDIDTSTTLQVTYNGKTKITVPKGQTVITDEIDISFDALEDLAITMELGTVPNTVTSHTASRCNTWVVSGAHGKDKALSGAEITTSWYFIRLATTLATEDTKVIVCFGDSLTDGASVTTNAFARWPDELARQLQNSEYDNYAVINMGIGATLLRWEMGRVARDILEIPGVDTLLVLYGINDIGSTNRNMANEIINLHKTLASQCHAKDINVYGMTMTPCNGSGYYSPKMEETRIDINKWMMSEQSAYDGYIDTASAVADPDDSSRMQKNMVSVWGDWLHFNDFGYKFLGKTVFERLSTTYLK